MKSSTGAAFECFNSLMDQEYMEHYSREFFLQHTFNANLKFQRVYFLNFKRSTFFIHPVYVADLNMKAVRFFYSPCTE